MKNDARLSMLAHPAWLLSLALLALNDHLLKHVPALAGTLTGKLSDFAGLVVAPPVLAALFRASSPRARALCLLLVGTGFAAIKVSSPCARALEEVLAAIGLPSRIWVDPTDLVALPSLLVAQRIMQRAEPVGRWFARTALVFGMLACVATSSSSFSEYTSAALVNHRNAPLDATVRVAPVDCESFTIEIAGQLQPGNFGAAREIHLAPQEWTFLEQLDGSCGVVWLTLGEQFSGVIAWEDVQGDIYEGDPIDRALLDIAVTVEGSRDRLRVSVGDELRSFPPPTVEAP